MAETKTVSVLMLDIQGSTPLVKQMGGEKYIGRFMPSFHAMLADHIEQSGTYFQKPDEMGDDCVKAIFDSPQDAVNRAIAIQNRFRDYGVMKDEDGNAVQVKLHLAIHTCPILSNGSPDVSEIPDLARLLKEANDGQILLSSACFAAYADCMAKQNVPPRPCEKFGGYLFKGIEGEQSIYSLLYDDVYRGAPGTQFIGFENLEAANEYITRSAVEKAVRDKFEEVIGRSGKIRFVTIYGEGGMGKTRLSINCARQLVGRFPGYVVFVPLAGLLKHDAEAVADAIYDALKLTKPSGADVQERWRQLGLYLNSRPATLLVLDNGETITSEENAVVCIQELLAGVPQLCILASSRAFFGFDAEGQIDINAGLTPWEAFQLFGERVRPGFVLPSGVTQSEINEVHAAMEAAYRQTSDYAVSLPSAAATERTHALQSLLRLFWLANRNTLALELIASWTNKYKAIDQLLADYQTKAFSRFTRHAGVPSGNEITRLRHKSLEASYLWSWNNLGAEENGRDAQTAFLAATLFAVSFTDEAIEVVLGGDAAISFSDEAIKIELGRTDADRTADATFAVQKASLLRSFAVTPTETRYQMHWQLQAFGRDEKYWKGSDENASNLPALAHLRQRIVAYYSGRMEKYGYEEGIKTAEGRAWLGAEWRNVVKAADYADDEAELEDAVWLRLSLACYFELTSKWSVWEEVGEKAKEAADRAKDKRNQAATLNNLGSVYRLQSKLQQAEDAHNAARILFQEVGDQLEEGKALSNLGSVYRLQGKWKQAEDACKQDLAVCQEFSDWLGQAQTLNNLGVAYEVQGKWNEAEDAYKQSNAIYEEIGNRYGQATTLDNLGGVCLLQNKWNEAEDASNAALLLFQEFGDLRGQGDTLSSLSTLWAKQGDFGAAANYAREGIAAVKQTEDTQLLQKLQKTLADCVAQSGAA